MRRSLTDSSSLSRSEESCSLREACRAADDRLNGTRLTCSLLTSACGIAPHPVLSDPLGHRLEVFLDVPFPAGTNARIQARIQAC